MKSQLRKIKNEAGFSLLEALVAIVIMLVVLLGVFSAFTWAVIYNTGNNTRSQTLSVLQREVELIRSYKFTPTITDDVLTGGEKVAKYVTSADGSNYKVLVVVDDDPYTAGIQINSIKTLKEITITVTPTNAVATWQTSNVSRVVMQRVRGN